MSLQPPPRHVKEFNQQWKDWLFFQYNEFSAGSGIYLQAANNLSDVASVSAARTNLGLVSGGSGDIWVDTAGDTMTGALNLAVGAVGAPTLRLTGDTTTGWYRSAANEWAFSSSGILQFKLATDQLTIGSNTATNPQIFFDCTNDGHIQWQNTPLTLNVRTNGSSFFDYPGSTSGFTINSNTTQNNDVRNAFAGWITASGTQTGGALYGFFGGYYDTGSSAVSLGIVVGAEGYNYLAATNSRTVSRLAAGEFINEFSGSNLTVTNVFGIRVKSALIGTSLTATNVFGVYIVHPDTGTITNAYGLYIENVTQGSTLNYSIYSNGGHSYHAGNFGIGQTTPTAKLHIAAGSTSASSAPIKLTSGSLMTTAEAGAVEFLTDKYYGTITTGAARKEFIQGDNAITEAVNLVFGTTTGTKIGTATTQKIALWNATPIVQPSTTGELTGFTANASANATFNESTWTGNVGTKAYTVSDIVKHLKNSGILAAS